MPQTEGASASGRRRRVQPRRSGEKLIGCSTDLRAFILIGAALLLWSAVSGARAPALPAFRAPHPGAAPERLPHASACSNQAVVPRWPIAQRVAQLVVVPAAETDVQAVLGSVRRGAGGIVLFGNEAPPELGSQLAALTSHSPHGVRPFVMTDEEGGGIQRMSNLVGSIPWPRTLAAPLTPTLVRTFAATVARQMRANGVTMDLARVFDIASGPGPDAAHTDGARSFSVNPSTASLFGVAFMNGLLEGGVVPVVKHFPGEGRADHNTDDGPASTPPLATLEKADLLPFEAAIQGGVPAIMVGNARVPGLTSGPASLSYAAITGLLRHELGFTGLILTDSLSALAIS